MSRIKLSHPRRRRLLQWLEDGRDQRITEHVATCDRCAQTLEELSAEVADAAPTDVELGDALRAVMVPPDDLNERVLRRIAERERVEREMSLLFDLIAIPKDAADLMMPPSGDRARTGDDDDQQREEQP